MAGKFLDNTGLSHVWTKLKAFFLPLTGGTITGNLTVNGTMKRSTIYGTPSNNDVPTIKWVEDNKTGKFTSTTDGIVPKSGGGTTRFLRADGTWQTPPTGESGNSVTVSTSQPSSPKIGDIWI